MATQAANFAMDYQRTETLASFGSLATGVSTGPITVGKNAILRIYGFAGTTAPVPVALRFSLGNSAGTTAPTPTVSMPFVFTNQVVEFNLGACYDQINLTNLAADNGATTINYSIDVLSRF